MPSCVHCGADSGDSGGSTCPRCGTPYDDGGGVLDDAADQNPKPAGSRWALWLAAAALVVGFFVLRSAFSEPAPQPSPVPPPSPDGATTDFGGTDAPPAPVRHYGAIAVAGDGSLGRAWDYDSADGAERAALDECVRSDCRVVVSFSDGCGSVAFNSATNVYWGGHGDTAEEAETNAISNAGGGRWITWVCTTR